MLTFDDFLIGMEQFGQRIQPLMQEPPQPSWRRWRDGYSSTIRGK